MLEKLKQFAPAQQVYLLASTNFEVIDAIKTEIEIDVIKHNEFVYPDESRWHKRGDRITFYGDICHIVTDTVQWERYINLCEEEYKRQGVFKGHNIDITWEARSMLKQAENCLLDWLENFLNTHELPQVVTEYSRKNTVKRAELIDFAMKISPEEINT